MAIIVNETKNASVNATTVDSTTVTGVVGTANIYTLSVDVKATLWQNYNVLRFNSAKEALETFKSVNGTLREVLYDIEQQNVTAPVIVSLVEIETSHYESDVHEFYADDAIKTAVIEAIGNLQRARTLYGSSSKVDIAIAPYFSHDSDVYNALDVFVNGTGAIAVSDLHLSTTAEALTALDLLGTDRQLVVPFYHKSWSVYENATVEKPSSSIIAGHIAYWDSYKQNGEFGKCFDHANRAINNVSGVTLDLKYEEGDVDCEVEVLVKAGACLLLNDDGWKLYNFETPSDDERFNKLDTVRTFDLLNRSLQKALKTHAHRPIKTVMSAAQSQVDVFLGKAVKAGALVGARVELSEQNTASELAVGKIYLDYYAGNNVGMRTLVLQPYATNEFYTLENLLGGN